MEVSDIDLKELIERETGNRFNRQGVALCPFHSEKTPSLKVKFLSDANKERYKCYGCGAEGDAVDFIEKTRNINYAEAREYLGIPLEKSIQELEIEKVRSRIEWEIKTLDHRKGNELLGLFNFVDRDNKPMYYKAKFKGPDGKKSISYYHLNNEGKIENKRNGEELLYNLYNVISASRDGKTIIITEGEKDCNSLNSLFRNKEYVATSCKGLTDFTLLRNCKIFVCGDTGEAGRKYVEKIKYELLECSQVFKVITLQGIKDLGDNKDVTDWLESGHTKGDLYQAFKRSLDLKSKYELQQDYGGIYKYIKGKGEEEVFTKAYISNFSLLEATRINFIDRDSEGVKVILKSCTGAEVERMDQASVFDDVKTFRGFLGSLDLSFTGSIGDLITLKIWINSYFALDLEEVHSGVKFIKKDNERMFITIDGAMSKDKINTSVKSSEGADVSIIEIEEINAKDMMELKKYLFFFASFEKTFCIIGSVINFLAAEQMESLGIKNHFLTIVGESGGGKSTVLEKVIAPLLNYPLKDKNDIGEITPFALIKNLSEGNYVSIFDEYKPSTMDPYKSKKIGGIFRNLYDRSTISRGDRSFKNKTFQLNRPMVLAGEESYPNAEKALIERSCIVYVSKREREPKHEESMEWLSKNEDKLNRLGKSLINTVLSLSTEDYQDIRNKVALSIEGMKDRPRNTCINICSGIEIMNILLKKLDLKQATKYISTVVKNIKEEVLEDREEALSMVEIMLKKYDSMIEDDRVSNDNIKAVIQRIDDKLYLKSSEMINQINIYLRSVNSSWLPLELGDFRKQAMKAGYLTGKGNKSIFVGLLGGRKTIRYDSCDVQRFRELEVNCIIPQEATEITDDNVIPFDKPNKAK